jgi:hypothetical protein
MSRVLCALALFSLLAAPCGAGQADGKPELLISLSVAPAAAPEPALKYVLLPELREMNPGNPIQGYMKCYLELYRFVFDEEEFDRRTTLLAMPLEELPAAEAPEVDPRSLAGVDVAARLDKPDWQVLLKLRADGIKTMLPDLQMVRNLARAVQARFRAEVGEGRVDDAIRTAKTMFAMGRHMGEYPTLIGGLVGYAIVNMAFGPLEALLERPECPNLYWALTNLPDPLISIRTGMEGERLMNWALFRELDRANPMSAEQIERFIGPVDAMFAEGDRLNIRGFLAERTVDERKLAAARKRLALAGLPEACVKAFVPAQVILLDDARECDARFDEIAKIVGFPAWRFEALVEQFATLKKEPAFFADALRPHLIRVRRAHARIEQRIGLLRHVEALRMYAAAHGGAFPAKLSEISVPLPDDPFTGKPFQYELTGKTARVRGTPPEAMENETGFRVQCEITLKN